MKSVANRLSEHLIESDVHNSTDKIYYLENLEKAKVTPGAIISKNPEFESFPQEYYGHREFNIYIPEKDDSTNNSLGDAFKNAKTLKKKNKPN